MRNSRRKDNGTEKDKERIEKLEKYRTVQLSRWRRSDEYPLYKHFMDHYGPKLVGSTRWVELRSSKTPEEWMTPYQEAFGLLTMENYEETVKERVVNGRTVTPKWTRHGTARRNQGYLPEGIKRYREILQEVTRARKDSCAHGEKYRDDWEEKEKNAAEIGKKRRLEEISSREKDVRLVLQIKDGEAATGFDGMEDFDVMELIQKRNKTNDTAL